MTAIKIGQHYFDLSNESDFESIQLLFSKSITYRSGSGELFIGVPDIIAMQRQYHGSFESLLWQVNTTNEIKPGIIQLDFSFSGISKSAEKVSYSGLETIIIYQGKIQHIDVYRR